MFNNKNKINAINLGYAQKLSLSIEKINIKAQKINSSGLKTFKMIITNFLIKNKSSKPWYF